jgi:hypothetical protein
MAPKLHLAETYARQNREAAEVILADAMRYGGDELLMARWARCVIADSERRAAA